jgi:Ca2+-binding EF-hand superfamily protein
MCCVDIIKYFKLTDQYKVIRRIFKQKDFNQTGYIPIVAFKEALLASKSNLNEEDIFNIVQRLDKDITGMINYNKFISEYIK